MLWALGLLVFSTAVSAAGLGRLTVLSNLGEPLRAEIELVAPEKGEQESLAAKLGSPDAYAQANLPFPTPSLGLQVLVQRRASGEMYVSATSSKPVTEPFLDLLLEVTWNGGRILRAYAALLDPPSFASPENPTAAVAPAPEVRPAPQAAPAPKGETIAEPAPAPTAPAEPAATTPAKSDSAKPATYGPVKSGETLVRIARKVKPEDLSLEQVMVLLFRANPDAFDGKNMNRLRRGRVLQVPDASQAGELSPAAAHKEVRLQAENFAAFRDRLASAAGAGAAQEAPGASASGKVTGKVEDRAAAGKPPAENVVVLSKAAPAGAKGDAGHQKEESAAKSHEMKESQGRIAQLEKTVSDLKALKEANQKPAPALAVTAPPLPVKPEPVKAPEVSKVPVKPESKPAEMAAAAGSSVAAVGNSGVQPTLAGEAKSAMPKPRPRPYVASKPPPPPPSFLNELLDQPALLGGAGAALLGGGGLLAYRLRQRGGKPAASRGAAPVPGGDDRKEPYTGTATDTGRSGAPAATTEEVDPLAEAEIYLAYGRDAQAEEILKDALQSPGQRPEVYLKLLEIYAKRKDVQAFEPVARDLQGVTGSTGEIWARAARLGFTIDPTNPRYAAGKEAATDFEHASTVAMAAIPGADEDKLDFDIGTLAAGVTPGTATDLDLADIGAQVGGTTTDLDLGALGPVEGRSGHTVDITGEATARLDAMDFDLDAPPVDASHEAVVADDGHSLDFDLDLDALSPPSSPEARTVLDLGAEHHDAGLDFDLEGFGGGESYPSPGTEPLGARSTTGVPDLDLSTIALDVSGAHSAGGAEPPKDAHWHDVQTKFDLARAYQEMGDSEGAREILREVVNEGDAGQKAEAEKLMSTIH